MSPARARLLLAAVPVLVALRPAAVLAHTGAPPLPHDLWRAWDWQPGVLAGIAACAWLYGRGLRVLWRRAGVGRGVRRWQAASYAGGLAALFVALVSPLDALSASLFSAHMVQHLLLILAAAPLLAIASPATAFLWALPRRWRRGVGGWWRGSHTVRAVWRTLSDPLVAWGLHAATLWLWHVPRLFEATLTSQALHALEHAALLGTAVLWWWTVAQSGRRGRLGYGAGLLSVFAMAVQSGALGALLTLAPAPWYSSYAPYTAAWGLTPLEDQQLAGLVMWIPAGLVYLGAMCVLFAAWLRAAEHQARRREAWADKG